MKYGNVNKMDGNEWNREDVQRICKGCVHFGECPTMIVVDAIVDEKCDFRMEE
jgi:hypothetical protein